MIAVRLQGRLGNQLFQYAFIIAASQKLNTNFYIDEYIEHSVVDKYFNNVTGSQSNIFIKLFKIRGYKNIFSFYFRRFYYKYLAKIRRFSIYEYDYNNSATEISPHDGKLYVGFFQSELFFDSIKETIKNMFTLKNAFTHTFKLKYDVLYKNNRIVAVHIRRTDYQYLPHLNLGGDDLSLPINYYKIALAKYQGQNVHFVFVTDDVDFVNQNFKDIKNKTISNDTEIMDFQHLLNADGCIISNSTFSWWGAWLNEKPDKAICAPKYFLGWRLKKQMPLEIYPKSWIQIDF